LAPILSPAKTEDTGDSGRREIRNRKYGDAEVRFAGSRRIERLKLGDVTFDLEGD